MVTILLTLVVVLLILQVAVVILFRKQGKRLKEEMEHAQESESIKTDSLSNVGMSFCEPLKAIIQNCDNLMGKDGIKNDQNSLDDITDIRNKSRQLIQYANELLDMSNTEASIPNSQKIEVNLIELIMSYRREILYDVKDNVVVNVRTDLSPHTKIWIHTTLFRQLVMHLLQCAATHTETGHITIRYATENRGIRFWIENTCKAIPQEIVDTFFTKQIDPSYEHLSDDKVTILSMAICKNIIDNLRGEIVATSKQSGQEFLLSISFWFPCRINTEG